MPLNDASAPDILPIGVRAPERITVSVMSENVSSRATGAEGQSDGDVLVLDDATFDAAFEACEELLPEVIRGFGDEDGNDERER